MKCAISIDVDSVNHLRVFYNLPTQDNNSVYEKAIPRILKLFDEFGIKATFFVVGEDCLRNKDILKAMISNGHEIANHSLEHKLAYSLLSKEEKVYDVECSTRLISENCGIRPVGFRVPGYDVDNDTLDILERNQYEYDSSLFRFFPYTIIRRLTYLRYGNIPLSKTFKKIFMEFNLISSGRKIKEIPISLAFNNTFIYLFSIRLFDLGLKMATKDIHYNFHASNLLHFDEININYPGFRLSLDDRLTTFRRIFDKIQKNYQFTTLRDYIK